MSEILIKGMEMPKERKMIEIFPTGEVFEVLPVYNTRLPINVRAIEVPTHGDLVDRQKLIKALSKAWDVDDDQDFANKSVWRIVEKEASTIIEASEERE